MIRPRLFFYGDFYPVKSSAIPHSHIETVHLKNVSRVFPVFMAHSKQSFFKEFVHVQHCNRMNMRIV